MNKGLEAFKRIGNAIDHADDMAMSYFEAGDFDIVEKQLEALDIIKQFIKSLGLIFIFADNKTILITDNDEFEYRYKCKTQEEYDLLKEVLLCLE